jgi:hypothetical protein
MNNIRSLRAVFVLFATGASLVSAQVLEPTKFAGESINAAAGISALGTARAAVARLRAGAPEAAVRIESVPIEFARVLSVMGYAGEAPKGFEDAAAALNYKTSYWSAHRTALRQRLAGIPQDERENREGTKARLDSLGDSHFDFQLSLEESTRGGSALARLSAEKLGIESDLQCVDAVLKDIQADQAGTDQPERILRRKAALMRSMAKF